MPYLAIGSQAPDFTLTDQHGRQQSLSTILKRTAVVLYFYPQDETYGCTKEACHFRDQYEEFVDNGVEVIGISSDSISSHMQFAGRLNLPFLLLSDPNRSVHNLYGVNRALWGIVAARVTFVIDQQGVIRHVFDSNLNFQGHVTTSLQIVSSFAAK